MFEQRQINKAGEPLVPPMSAAIMVRPKENKILVQQEDSRRSFEAPMILPETNEQAVKTQTRDAFVI